MFSWGNQNMCCHPTLGWDALPGLEAVEEIWGWAQVLGLLCTHVPLPCVLTQQTCHSPHSHLASLFVLRLRSSVLSPPAEEVYGLSLRGPGSIPHGRWWHLSPLKHVARSTGLAEATLGACTAQGKPHPWPEESATWLWALEAVLLGEVNRSRSS